MTRRSNDRRRHNDGSCSLIFRFVLVRVWIPGDQCSVGSRPAQLPRRLRRGWWRDGGADHTSGGLVFVNIQIPYRALRLAVLI